MHPALRGAGVAYGATVMFAVHWSGTGNPSLDLALQATAVGAAAPSVYDWWRTRAPKFDADRREDGRSE